MGILGRVLKQHFGDRIILESERCDHKIVFEPDSISEPDIRAHCIKCGRTGHVVDGLVEWEKEPTSNAKNQR